MFTVTIYTKEGKMHGYPINGLKMDMVLYIIEHEAALGRSVTVALDEGA